jgi:hypothetical protein
MNRCSVRGCGRPGVALLDGQQASIRQAVLCAEHDLFRSAGAAWIAARNDKGVLEVLMGSTAAPRVWEIVVHGESASESGPGILVRFETERDRVPCEPVEVWLTRPVARDLLQLLGKLVPPEPTGDPDAPA